MAAMLVWAYLTALRILRVPPQRRNGRHVRLATLLYYAPAMLWSAFVLRPLRFYGIATYRRQGWTTRTEGVEMAIAPAANRIVA